MYPRLFAAAAVVLGACKFEVSPGVLDEAELEAVLRDGVPGATVECADDVPAAIGATVACKVTVEGRTYEVIATVTNPGSQAGRYAFQLRLHGRELVVARKLADALAADVRARHGADLAVDCGEPLRPLADDRAVTCAAEVAGARVEVVARLDAALGLESYDFAPMLLARDALVDAVTPQLRARMSPSAVVTCGDHALVPRPADGAVTCAVADGDTRAGLEVAVDDDGVVTGWRVVPAS